LSLPHEIRNLREEFSHNFWLLFVHRPARTRKYLAENQHDVEQRIVSALFVNPLSAVNPKDLLRFRRVGVQSIN
jgi:hypothetical protein